MNKIVVLLLILVGVSCSKPPSPPGPVSLVYPSKNLECTEGTVVADKTRAINFQWATATHTDQYRLSVVDLESGLRYSRTTSSTAIEITLDTRKAYSWNVTASNQEVIETSVSEDWYFYVAGASLSHIPYQAYPIAPVPGSFIDANENNQVYLQWIAADSDNDISGFEVYFDTQNPPVTLLDLGSGFTTNTFVDVSSNTRYYWKIKVIDQQGNSSLSPIFDFKVN
ncbi:MAG: hypothetical protein HWD84_03930 [Flavobacteriaceae bacterium]|jgi:hypothetical protein|nr:hypothetical protein [Flavobacteriaceae bacterium]NVJ72688.1 hypothetical protein [Flavobacteriaceae bacterium]